MFNSNSGLYSYQIQCYGDNSGYVDIQATGGTQPYYTNGNTFLNNTLNIAGLSAGNQNFIVQDANGCTYSETIMFNQPSPIQHNFIPTHVTCSGWSNGSLTDSVYGGVGNATTYSYSWDNLNPSSEVLTWPLTCVVGLFIV